MRLHEADVYLESARLALSTGDESATRASLHKAKVLIDEIGYHRRDRDVAEIESRLS
jgi:hypothetical protein